MSEYSLIQKLRSKARALVSVPLVMLALALVATGCALPKEEVPAPIGFTFTNGDTKAELTRAPTFTPTTWIFNNPANLNTTYTVTVPVDSDTQGVWVAMVPDATSSGSVPAFNSAIHASIANPTFTAGSAQSVSVPLIQASTTVPATGTNFTAMVMVCSSACTPSTSTAGVSFAYFTVNGNYVKIDPNTSNFVITGITGQSVTAP